MGTLLYYQNEEGESLSILDSIEKCLLNFWRSLDIDPYKKPRDRWLTIFKKLEIEVSIDYYLDLEIFIKDLASNDENIRNKLNLLLLDFNDIKNLKQKLLTLEIDQSVVDFLDWLNKNNYIDFDIVYCKNKLLNFNPIGSVNLVLIAFIVEGLLLTSRYLSYLDTNIRMLEIQDFIAVKQYESIRSEIANYLVLAYDANNYLSESFDDSNLLKESLFNTIKMFMVNDIDSEGDYRLDG